MGKGLLDPGRRLRVLLFAAGAAAVIAGLLVALSEGTPPYGLAGALVALGTFVLGIGVGGVLFTPRKAAAAGS